MALVCKKCGCKQDEQIVEGMKKRFPNMNEHDIPYYCETCLDTAADDEYDHMVDEMNGVEAKRYYYSPENNIVLEESKIPDNKKMEFTKEAVKLTDENVRHHIHLTDKLLSLKRKSVISYELGLFIINDDEKLKKLKNKIVSLYPEFRVTYKLDFDVQLFDCDDLYMTAIQLLFGDYICLRGVKSYGLMDDEMKSGIGFKLGRSDCAYYNDGCCECNEFCNYQEDVKQGNCAGCVYTPYDVLTAISDFLTKHQNAAENIIGINPTQLSHEEIYHTIDTLYINDARYSNNSKYYFLAAAIREVTHLSVECVEEKDGTAYLIRRTKEPWEYTVGDIAASEEVFFQTMNDFAETFGKSEVRRFDIKPIGKK